VKTCHRCGKWFNGTDSDVCDPCWEDMGQMSFWQDEDEYEPPIDTVFDREEEARGYQ